MEKTPGLLLEKPTTLDTYVEKGWQLVATGFRPFFPSLASISEADLSSLEEKFKTKAAMIGKAMMNKDGMIEDKHVNLWVTAIADC